MLDGVVLPPGLTPLSPRMGQAREDARATLQRFDVSAAERATDTDSTEEIILLSENDFESVDVHTLTLALMDVLPHMKVWVIETHPLWTTESI
jgi:hypothetical protein